MRIMFGRAARLEAVIETMAKGASQQAAEKVLRIASRHAQGRLQEAAELVGQLVKTEESLVQQLDRWVHEYRGGLADSDAVKRWERAFASEQQRRLVPLKKQLIKKAKQL